MQNQKRSEEMLAEASQSSRVSLGLRRSFGEGGGRCTISS